MYQSLLKPLLFRLQPEKAHHVTMALFKTLLAFPGGQFLAKLLWQYRSPHLERTYFGVKFPNPVGLAAGFDKDGKYFEAMSHLGFGFIEIGTVTPLPQDGNPQPRLFRLPESAALINRMGFNNEGVEALAERLKAARQTPAGKHLCIGGNIGKNKVTPNEKAYLDYEICFKTLFPYVDYFVVNVSSPNTPDLRALQDKEPLNHLLAHLQACNAKMPQQKPILLKIAPDLNPHQLDDILEIVHNNQLAGLIASNTTIERQPLKEDPLSIEAIGAGGLSGRPLKERSTAVIQYLRAHGRPDLIIIGVGGIHSGADAVEKIEAGANLIQIYTGLIYEGAGLVKNILKTLDRP